ncbi:MAG: hypothetical protein AAGE01_10670 [Pseudomonadota bacterium]
MPFVLRDQVVFYHVPKTGGTWLRNLLRDAGLLQAQRGRKHDPPGLDRFLPTVPCEALAEERERRRSGARATAEWSFCFVRHPLTWYESWFRYMSARAWKPWRQAPSFLDWHPCAPLEGQGADRFEDFVENVLRRRPGFVSELYFSFTPHVSRVGRYEDLRKSASEILQQVGLWTPELATLADARAPQNVSPPTPTPWDPALRDEILAAERPALLRFGYAR